MVNHKCVQGAKCVQGSRLNLDRPPNYLLNPLSRSQSESAPVSYLGEYSGTRDRKYPTYIPEDTKIEGFCIFSELKQRIEKLETLLDQVCQQIEKTG
jgi:hypothetical protein